MTINFPYEKSFVAHLTAADKQPKTITQYQLTLTDFFNYEQHFNDTFAASNLLVDLTENDIKLYLAMLKDNRHYQQSTLNKTLSNLNGYFSYLFEHRIMPTLPTFAIKGQPLTNEQLPADWPTTLPELLKNDDLHVYTRAFLLLTCKGYTVSEMLAVDFYQTLKKITFTTSEQVFLSTLTTFLSPLQSHSQTNDIFLKTRQRGQDPHLSLAALHKYLAGDGQRLGLPLKPTTMRQSYILWYLRQHRSLDSVTVLKVLRLDIESLDYYQNLLRKQDLKRLRSANQ